MLRRAFTYKFTRPHAVTTKLTKSMKITKRLLYKANYFVTFVVFVAFVV